MLFVPVRVSSRAAKSTPMSLRPGANVVPGVTFIRPLGPSMVDSATHVQEPSGFRLKPLCIAVIYRPFLLLALLGRQADAPVCLAPPVRHCRSGSQGEPAGRDGERRSGDGNPGHRVTPPVDRDAAAACRADPDEVGDRADDY